MGPRHLCELLLAALGTGLTGPTAGPRWGPPGQPRSLTVALGRFTRVPAGGSGRAGVSDPPAGPCSAVPPVPGPSPRLGTHGCRRSLSSPQERCCGCGRAGAPARTPRRASCPSASCWRASCARGSDVSDPWCPGGRWQRPRARGEESRAPFLPQNRPGVSSGGIPGTGWSSSPRGPAAGERPELGRGENLSCGGVCHRSDTLTPKSPGAGSTLRCAAKAAFALPEQAGASVRPHPQGRGRCFVRSALQGKALAAAVGQLARTRGSCRCPPAGSCCPWAVGWEMEA